VLHDVREVAHFASDSQTRCEKHRSEVLGERSQSVAICTTTFYRESSFKRYASNRADAGAVVVETLGMRRVQHLLATSSLFLLHLGDAHCETRRLA